jgi:hypothetical protein
MRNSRTQGGWENNIKSLEEGQAAEEKQHPDRQTGFHLTAIINLIIKGTFPRGNQQEQLKVQPLILSYFLRRTVCFGNLPY